MLQQLESEATTAAETAVRLHPIDVDRLQHMATFVVLCV